MSSTVRVRVFDAEGRLVGPVEMPHVVKSDEEWRAQLTPEQYTIARGKGTERPFCGTLLDNKRSGVYTCICCALPLFASNSKFHSGTGWPSFFTPIAEENVLTEQDRTYGMIRTEILCARCDAHAVCAADLQRDPNDPVWESYCPNAAKMLVLARERWTAA